MENLMAHEITHIIQVLRRDMRREELLVDSEPEFAQEHYYNARKNKDLLQQLVPKRNAYVD